MNTSSLFKKAQEYEGRGEIEKAYQFYLEAALTEDDGEAMYALARMYYEGDHVEKNYEKAGHYFAKAYEHGVEVATWTLIIAASCLEEEAKDTPEKMLKAIEYYDEAGKRGILYGYECLGKIYIDLKEYDKAYENLMKSDEKNSCGLYYLGKMYEEGLGVEKNINIAIEKYKKAVEVWAPNEEEYGINSDCELARERLKALGISGE